MSPAATFHAQLASIMEVLANTAVAEICELVDSGYSLLQLEISRSRKDNELLRRKLRLMELKAARANALRSAASGTALLGASGRARAQLAAHHSGKEAKRKAEGGVELPRASPQDPPPASGQEAAQLTSSNHITAVIKVEDDDEDWSQTEQDKGFCRVNSDQATETDAQRQPAKQEATNKDKGPSQSWMSSEVSSTSTLLQKTLNASSYDCLVYEPPLQQSSSSTQNPKSEDPGCSYLLDKDVGVSADSDSSSFPFTITEVMSVSEHQQPAVPTDSQQRAQLAPDKPQPPVRKEVRRRSVRRPQDGVNKAGNHFGFFVCNFCGKSLSCLKNLKTHMRVHTGEKPFVCSLCGKRFSDSSNLKRHQSVHTGEKRYGCAHCSKRFAQSGSLKVHMTVHAECKQLCCSHCGKTFISSVHLRRHALVHVGKT